MLAAVLLAFPLRSFLAFLRLRLALFFLLRFAFFLLRLAILVLLFLAFLFLLALLLLLVPVLQREDGGTKHAHTESTRRKSQSSDEPQRVGAANEAHTLAVCGCHYTHLAFLFMLLLALVLLLQTRYSVNQRSGVGGSAAVTDGAMHGGDGSGSSARATATASPTEAERLLRGCATGLMLAFWLLALPLRILFLFAHLVFLRLAFLFLLRFAFFFRFALRMLVIPFLTADRSQKNTR
jgi:hypothetical protein